MPSIPEDQLDTTEVAVNFPSLSNLDQNTVQVPYTDIPLKSTVVISFAGRQDSRQGVDDSHPASVAVRDVLQKELLRKGFRVLDQSQVNDSLLQLAIAGNCKDRRLWWRCTPYIQVEDAMALDQLQQKLGAGEIEPQAFAEEVSKQRLRWQSRATDVNALLDAIKAGKVEADYVFEIREFQPQRLVKQTYNLNKSSEVRDFIKNYPELLPAFSEKGVVRCAALGAEMKARLIDTNSSEVVWIGQHLLSEMNLPENRYLLELGVRKYAANVDEVSAAINDYNTKKGGRKSSGNPVPNWRFETGLVGPNLLQGSCDVAVRQTDELVAVSTKLSSRVARELVSTIRTESVGGTVGSDTLVPSTPDFKSNIGDKPIKKNPNATSFEFFESSGTPVIKKN
jgi:hypothetical protein